MMVMMMRMMMMMMMMVMMMMMMRMIRLRSVMLRMTMLRMMRCRMMMLRRKGMMMLSTRRPKPSSVRMGPSRCSAMVMGWRRTVVLLSSDPDLLSLLRATPDGRACPYMQFAEEDGWFEASAKSYCGGSWDVELDQCLAGGSWKLET